MFGLGMGEIVLIAIVALLFVGPDKLPIAAKSIGKTIRGLRRQTRQLTNSLEGDNEIGDAVREIRSALRDDPDRFVRRTPTAAAVASAGEKEESPSEPEPPMEEDVDPGAEDSDSHSKAEKADPALPRIGPAPGAIARGSSPAQDSEAGDVDDDSPPQSDHG